MFILKGFLKNGEVHHFSTASYAEIPQPAGLPVRVLLLQPEGKPLIISHAQDQAFYQVDVYQGQTPVANYPAPTLPVNEDVEPIAENRTKPEIVG